MEHWWRNLLDHFISPSVLSSRARDSVARIYPHRLPASCKHVETKALSKKDRMRANKRRNASLSISPRSWEIDHAIVDLARSSELTWRRPLEGAFLIEINPSIEIVQIFSTQTRVIRGAFVFNEWISGKRSQSRNKHLEPLCMSRLVSPSNRASRFPNVVVWLVHLARFTHASV